MSSDSKNQPILTLGWKPLASFWNFPMALCVRLFDLCFVCLNMKEPLPWDRPWVAEEIRRWETDGALGIKETDKGTRTTGVIRAAVGEGPGLVFLLRVDRAAQNQGIGEEPPGALAAERPAERAWEPPAQASQGQDGVSSPGHDSVYCTVCGFVFLVGILVHFSGLAAISPGRYALFSNTCPTVLFRSNTDEDAWGPVPRLRAAGLAFQSCCSQAKRPGKLPSPLGLGGQGAVGTTSYNKKGPGTVPSM